MNGTKRKLSAAELAVIIEHNTRQLEAAYRHIARIKPMIGKYATPELERQYRYYKNYAAAMKHSIAVAHQRAGVQPPNA